MSVFDLETDNLLRAQILERFVGELMTDRERAKLFGLPEGCRIREHAKILAPANFKCGKNLWIGEGAVLDAQGGLEVGEYTQIGLGVMIWTHSSHKQAIAGQTGVSRDEITYKPTKIGSRVFIAGPSVVLAGVTIGDGAIVQPLSLVSRDLAAGEIYGTAHEIRATQARDMRAMKKRIDALEAALAALQR